VKNRHARVPAPGPDTPEDAEYRPDREIWADPNTPEAAILARSLNYPGRLEAAASRAVKSHDLVEHIIGALREAVHFGEHHDTDSLVCGLTREATLEAQDLDELASIIYENTLYNGQALGDVCNHRLAGTEISINLAWHSPPEVASRIATATGTTAAPATYWVKRQMSAYERENASDWCIPERTLEEIIRTTARWELWTGHHHGRRAFLNANFYVFTDEAQMLAAGEAITGAPRRA